MISTGEESRSVMKRVDQYREEPISTEVIRSVPRPLMRSDRSVPRTANQYQEEQTCTEKSRTVPRLDCLQFVSPRFFIEITLERSTLKAKLGREQREQEGLGRDEMVMGDKSSRLGLVSFRLTASFCEHACLGFGPNKRRTASSLIPKRTDQY